MTDDDDWTPSDRMWMAEEAALKEKHAAELAACVAERDEARTEADQYRDALTVIHMAAQNSAIMLVNAVNIESVARHALREVRRA